MGSVNGSVDLRRDGDVAVLTLDNPPVNALKHEVRAGLAEALGALRGDASVRAVVLTGSERAFSGGADITEFGHPPREPILVQVLDLLDAMDKPVVAAIRGVALGGGLELALACHARVAWTGARLGLPEVKLGLLPGAGGTQRLPRLVGPARALRMIVSGEPVTAEQAQADGLVDAILDGPCPQAAIAWARTFAARGAPARVRDRQERLEPARADPDLLAREAAPLLRRTRGARAPLACVEAVRAAVEKPFDQGIAAERALFRELVASDESRAQRHVFFAERAARRVPGMPEGTAPRPVARAVVIGAGTMGGGIAMSFANAGIPVTVVEAEAEALRRGLDRVAGNYRISAGRGGLSEAEMQARLGRIAGGTDLGAVAEADIVIEAVFEDMPLKRRLFADLDRLARPGAVLATNTSTLDVNEIAAVTARPEDVLGMHFFSPANVMRLLEVVRAARTAPDALATALAVGQRIGKIPVVVGVCDGFVGNRMLAQRSRQAERLLLEGALPEQVDAAVTGFGFPMGPFAMGDLAGLDVSWRVRQARGTEAPVSDALHAAGRYGQKTGAGYYRYEPGSRTPVPDPEVARACEAASARLSISRRDIGKQEILDRMLLPMINEGARILEEGIAARPGDIDVIWVYGYGWPAFRGGPMWYADLVGLREIRDRLSEYAARTGDASLRPAPLLARLAEAGEGFGSLPAPA